jgi:membrane protease YdiL (CAAX protease family)
MNRMHGSLRSFWITLVIGEVLASIAALIYAHELSIPPSITRPVLAALLIEFAFYLVPGFEQARCALARRVPPRLLALLMTVSAVLPYSVYSAFTDSFRLSALAVLLGIAAAVSFWYILLPRHASVDAGFLVLLAAVVLSKVFSRIYADPVPRLHIELLGQLMLIRLGAMAALLFRRAEGVGFSFIPQRREWAIGVRHFLYFLPVAFFLSLWLRFASWHPPAMVWWKAALLAAATFFGILWVVALSEEFFFRGLLQQWLSAWLGSASAGLAIASILFGLVHLWFRTFPNWRFAILAAVAGCFYGRAYQQAGAIRAPMVTHALVVTTWKVLFS